MQASDLKPGNRVKCNLSSYGNSGQFIGTVVTPSVEKKWSVWYHHIRPEQDSLDGMSDWHKNWVLKNLNDGVISLPSGQIKAVIDSDGNMVMTKGQKAQYQRYLKELQAKKDLEVKIEEVVQALNLMGVYSWEQKVAVNGRGKKYDTVCIRLDDIGRAQILLNLVEPAAKEAVAYMMKGVQS